VAFRNATRDHVSPGRRHLAPEDWKAIEQLVANGLTDVEVAERVGCSSKTVARWRWDRDHEPRD
jgi:DNA-binding NarL/FixJ family response regulator